MDCGLSRNQLTEFLALMDKLQIELNPNLTRAEKEIYKQVIDQIKQLAQQ